MVAGNGPNTSLPTFPLIGKWGDFVDSRKFGQLTNYLLFSIKKSLNLILFRKFVLKSKTNKDKSTEIFPKLLI